MKRKRLKIAIDAFTVSMKSAVSNLSCDASILLQFLIAQTILSIIYSEAIDDEMISFSEEEICNHFQISSIQAENRIKELEQAGFITVETKSMGKEVESDGVHAIGRWEQL